MIEPAEQHYVQKKPSLKSPVSLDQRTAMTMQLRQMNKTGKKFICAFDATTVDHDIRAMTQGYSWSLHDPLWILHDHDQPKISLSMLCWIFLLDWWAFLFTWLGLIQAWVFVVIGSEPTGVTQIIHICVSFHMTPKHYLHATCLPLLMPT